jgi:hypothetical protein
MTDHLSALELRLSHERVRLANATSDGERAMRQVWVAGIEKEIAAERRFLAEQSPDLTDDELLAALTGPNS